MEPHSQTPRYGWLGIGAICRLDRALLTDVVSGRRLLPLAWRCALITAVGCFVYGLTFGIWRAPEQGLYSAIKLPLLVFAVVVATTLANGIVAQLLRARIGILQGLVVVLMSLTVSSALLGAMAPISLFLVLSIPSPLGQSATNLAAELAQGDPRHLHRTAQLVLFLHVMVVAFAGVIGNLRLYALLRLLIPEPAIARRVLSSWLIMDAFVGSQLSWILRPFLCKPGLPAAWLRPDAFNGNFFEEMGRIVAPWFS